MPCSAHTHEEMSCSIEIVHSIECILHLVPPVCAIMCVCVCVSAPRAGYQRQTNSTMHTAHLSVVWLLVYIKLAIDMTSAPLCVCHVQCLCIFRVSLYSPPPPRLCRHLSSKNQTLLLMILPDRSRHYIANIQAAAAVAP